MEKAIERVRTFSVLKTWLALAIFVSLRVDEKSALTKSIIEILFSNLIKMSGSPADEVNRTERGANGLTEAAERQMVTASMSSGVEIPLAHAQSQPVDCSGPSSLDAAQKKQRPTSLILDDKTPAMRPHKLRKAAMKRNGGHKKLLAAGRPAGPRVTRLLLDFETGNVIDDGVLYGGDLHWSGHGFSHDRVQRWRRRATRGRSSLADQRFTRRAHL